MKTIKMLVIIFVTGLTSINANAAIILNGNQTVQAFSLSESFKSFYDLGGNLPNSSNTGLEKIDTAVMLIAEFGGQYALIGTFGGLPSIGDDFGGSLTMSLTNNGTGSFILVDDPSDTVTTLGNETIINFDYNNRRNDGFIFFLGSGDDVDISLSMSDLVGINDFEFLNSGDRPFDINSSFTLGNAVSVSEPFGTLGLFILSLFCITRANKKFLK